MSAPTRLPITSRSAFHEALRSAFSRAAAVGAREIWLCDPDFADWPLSEPGIINDLTEWARPHRQLTVYAHRYGEVARRHGRWTQWRRQWSHLVNCRTNPELESAEYPTLCLIPGVVSLRLMDTVNFRGMASHDPADAIACREAIDVVSQRSTEAFPVTTLGL
jgi:hypothetical protein